MFFIKQARSEGSQGKRNRSGPCCLSHNSVELLQNEIEQQNVVISKVLGAAQDPNAVAVEEIKVQGIAEIKEAVEKKVGGAVTPITEIKEAVEKKVEEAVTPSCDSVPALALVFQEETAVAERTSEKEEEGEDDGNESSEAVSKPGLSKSSKKRAKKKKSAAAKAQQ